MPTGPQGEPRNAGNGRATWWRAQSSATRRRESQRGRGTAGRSGVGGSGGGAIDEAAGVASAVLLWQQVSVLQAHIKEQATLLATEQRIIATLEQASVEGALGEDSHAAVLAAKDAEIGRLSASLQTRHGVQLEADGDQ